MASNQQNNDFFQYLAQNNQTNSLIPKKNSIISNDSDPVVFKDKDGNLKMMVNGQVKPFDFDSNDAIDSSQTPREASQHELVDFDQIAEKITKGIKSIADLDQQKKQLYSIIKTRLKGARNQVQTREILMSAPEAGGLSFSEAQVDEITYAINKEIEKINSLNASRPRLNTVAAVLKPEATDIKSAKPEEVQFHAKLTGPIQELASISLDDFRRLGDSPQRSAENIKEKIRILGLDSFSRQVDGVKAWQKSPVNQVYLSIATKCLKEKRPVQDVLSSQVGSKRTLSSSEFSTIAQLNNDLRSYR